MESSMCLVKRNPEKSCHIKFTPEEDKKLREIVEQVGTTSWPNVAKYLKGRSSRQCRDRWNHYLSPSANLKEWTHEEEELLLSLYRQYGTKWAFIASLFPGRTAACVRTHCCRLQRIMERNKIRESQSVAQQQPQPISMVNYMPDYEQVIPPMCFPQQAPQYIPAQNMIAVNRLPSIYQLIVM